MWKDYRPGVPAGSTIRKQGVNFFSGMNERGRTAGKPFSLAWSLLHEPPAFLLYTTLRRVQNHKLAALLELGIAKDQILTLVVVVDVFGGRLVGMHPLGRGTGGQRQYSNGEHAHRTHEVLLFGLQWRHLKPSGNRRQATSVLLVAAEIQKRADLLIESEANLNHYINHPNV